MIGAPILDPIGRGDRESSNSMQVEELRPNVTPARISNSDVLLTGIVRCECCGSPLMVRTGKSGRYRYYACASHRLKGKVACSDPVAIREQQLDEMVLMALTGELINSPPPCNAVSLTLQSP